MKDKIDFDCEVEVQISCKDKKYIGCKGRVVGISEEDGIIYGYGVVLEGKDTVNYFDKIDIKPTGRQFKQEYFYS